VHYLFTGKVLRKRPTSAGASGMSGNSNRWSLLLRLFALSGACFGFVEQPLLAYILCAPAISLAPEQSIFEKAYLFFQDGDVLLKGDDGAAQFFYVVR
jgi:hypothetical protein